MKRVALSLIVFLAALYSIEELGSFIGNIISNSICSRQPLIPAQR